MAPPRPIPMRFESTVPDCLVTEGEIPEGLAGGFYRNGPTWRRPTKQGHTGLYSTDGMVQALVLQDGKATFTNKWVRTPKYVAEEQAGRALFEYADGAFRDYRCWALGDVVRDEDTAGIPQGTNYINAVPFAGQVLALGEMGGAPIALDPITLETLGTVPWSAELAPSLSEPAHEGDGSFCAHPKWDHATGELFGWTFSDREPYCTLQWVTPDGVVRIRPLWDAPYNALVHDIWLTEHYVVVPFQPLTVSRERVANGLSTFGWDESLPIVLALVPRQDIDGEIRWITADIEAQYVMHTMSANEVDDTIVLDGPIFRRPPFAFEDQFSPGDPFPMFWELDIGRTGRWIVNLTDGSVKSEVLSDVAVEFPKVDERYYGRPYEWGYMLAGVERGMLLDSLLVRNVRTGAEQTYLIAGEAPLAIAEPTFVPRRPDAPEGDGYLIVPASSRRMNSAEFLIFDTDDIAVGPCTRIQIPFQLGWTPHGHWMSFS